MQPDRRQGAANSGRMMRRELLVSGLLRQAARHAGGVEVVSAGDGAPPVRLPWSGVELRARGLAASLAALGLVPGDRVATLGWNTFRHVEAYYATAGSGLVCHTVNPRLGEDQLAWLLDDARDAALFFDPAFAPLVARLLPRLASALHLVAMAPPEAMERMPRGALCHDTLAANGAAAAFSWPQLGEDSPCGLCYTSGTTGDPKGVLYTQRSTVLHAMATTMPDSMGLSSRDTVLPVVPMFHVNAWGLPYSCALVGAKLVLPGQRVDGPTLVDLIDSEGVTFSAGVPTVWLGVLAYLEASGRRLGTLQRILVGGSAAPPALIDTLERKYGVEVLHGWGMTELSPSGTVARLRARHLQLPAAERLRRKAMQGPAIPGIDMEVLDEEGRALPWDGRSSGQLVVRGHWVVERYDGAAASALVRAADGTEWFPTGDIATIDADGFLQITDRSKDLIKSGGEWISSIALENIAMAHPGVALAACVGVAHPRWDERPVVAVVRKPDAACTREELLACYGSLPRWQVPDDIVFLDALPLTATGKVLKHRLREQLRGHLGGPAAI